MIDNGCVTALRLDGGGSSQLSAEGVELPSPIGRLVHNYICLWGDVDASESKEKPEEINMFKLALGAGHGLTTAGKRCLKALDPNETREWWLNDRICDYVEAYLKDYEGYELLRLDDSDDGADDVALEKRVNMANSWGADFYLSVHHNAGINGGSGGGIVAYSYPGSTKGAEWRDAFYEALLDHTGLKGNRSDGTQTANFYVLKYSNMPSTLLELGFMDSTTDVPIILTDLYAQKCARAIVKVVVARGGLKKKATTTVDQALYKVQLGAFSNRKNAEALAAELKAKGYQVYITKASKAGGSPLLRNFCCNSLVTMLIY